MEGGRGFNVKDRQVINVHQFTILVIFFGLGSSILIAPSALAAVAKQDSWISSILGALAGLIPIVVYVSLLQRYPQKTIIEINELVFGKWLGKTVSVLYIFFFFLLSVLLLGDIGYFVTTEIMPETPIDFVMACLMFVVIYACRLGLEVITKGAEIFFPWILLLYFLLLFMLLPQIHVEKIQPVLEYGITPVLKAAFPFFSLQEYIVLIMFYPYVKLSKKTPQAFYIGALIAGVMLICLIMLCILVLGPKLTTENLYPTFALAKKINIGNFIERVEVIIGGLWFITISFKLLMTFFSTVLGIRQMCRFKSYTFLTIPLGMLTVALVLPSYVNIVYVNQFVKRIWPSFSLIFMLLLPLLTWLIALFRKNHGLTIGP